MSEEFEDRASALLKDLKTNPRDSGGSGGSSGSDDKGLVVDENGKPIKKKKKKLWLVVPLLPLIGVGIFVGLVASGTVKNKMVAGMLGKKEAAVAATAAVVVPDGPTPAELEQARKDAEEEALAAQKKKDKALKKAKAEEEARLEALKEAGAKRLSGVWTEMDAAAIVKVAAGYKDADLARVLGFIDADKAAEVLAQMDPKRATKVSQLIEAQVALVPSK